MLVFVGVVGEGVVLCLVLLYGLFFVVLLCCVWCFVVGVVGGGYDGGL